VTPEQAQTLTLAQSLGTISLSLRHVTDAAPVNRLVTTPAAFSSYQAFRRLLPRLTHAVTHVGPTVRVTRGAETSVVELSSR
jgi:pilus assembly protein CpaB